MIKRIGKRTLALENRPYLLGHAAAVGKKEGEGPLGERFDYVAKNDRMGQRSWELAESELQKTAIRLALRKATLPERSLDLILAGDLLNQCIGSFLASMHANVPYLGQYGACSTMAQGLALGGCLVESGAADHLLAAASSHFCSAERQYRFPLAYGGQRTPTAQWTATAAGATVLGSKPVPNGAEPCDVRVTHVLFGKMVEMGVKDAANMGAAMAPEDVNLDPYIFRCAERCVLHKICCYQNHSLVFPSKRTNTDNPPDTGPASRGILSAQMLFLSKHRRGERIDHNKTGRKGQHKEHEVRLEHTANRHMPRSEDEQCRRARGRRQRCHRCCDTDDSGERSQMHVGTGEQRQTDIEEQHHRHHIRAKITCSYS
ncbi:hypothetical protein DW088_12985 [Butyricicoccus sp. AM05-1]|uniref:hypothetical protein n=1 Tax=Butyricicoccus sp. AM05-1 TaxID=2292004 RepID=UPI000E4FE006|nr:hypothetical protein [Butyricicoccus sp. AM05-1]RHO61665.1 hypothetical protein DW088_12985 [Butyricicoccus sp. AM05-1]